MNGDETTADMLLNSFPSIFKGATPEIAAAKFAEQCHRKSRMFPEC
jgi:hypothetical protein